MSVVVILVAIFLIYSNGININPTFAANHKAKIAILELIGGTAGEILHTFPVIIIFVLKSFLEEQLSCIST